MITDLSALPPDLEGGTMFIWPPDGRPTPITLRRKLQRREQALNAGAFTVDIWLPNGDLLTSDQMHQLHSRFFPGT